MSRLELAMALRNTAATVMADAAPGSQPYIDALAVMRHADDLDRPISQTAIVAGLGGEHVRITLIGVHVPADAVRIESAPVARPWRPVAPERIDVRHE